MVTTEIYFFTSLRNLQDQIIITLILCAIALEIIILHVENHLYNIMIAQFTDFIIVINFLV
jgi:hypothetical protein